MTMDQYLDELDFIDVQNAMSISGMPDEVSDWIWEVKRTAFEQF